LVSEEAMKKGPRMGTLVAWLGCTQRSSGFYNCVQSTVFIHENITRSLANSNVYVRKRQIAIR